MTMHETVLETEDERIGRGKGGTIAVQPLSFGKATNDQIDSRWRREGVVYERPEQNSRSRSRLGPAVAKGRARYVPGQKRGYVYDPSFDAPEAASTILAPMPASAQGTRSAVEPATGLPSYLASLYLDSSLLNPEQEVHLFRKMNYLKYRAAKSREALDAVHPRTNEIERLEAEARAVRNQIVRANLRLVVSIARRLVRPGEGLFELISDGNLSLIHAVEKFDYTRGFKFSTYASRAIMKNYARSRSADKSRGSRFITGHEEAFEVVAAHRTSEHESECTRKRMQEAIKGMLVRLDDRENRIIVSRYGLNGGEKLTLEQLGKELGLTKERVRQLSSRALEKLRDLSLRLQPTLPHDEDFCVS
jgi:RNA polymerase sigma factor (sigma-70 family)